MKTTLVLFVVFSFFLSLSLAYTRYDAFQVIKANVQTEAQRLKLESFEIDIWSNDGQIIIGENDIMVNDEQLQLIEKVGVEYTITISNVEDMMADSKAEEMRAFGNAPLAFFDAYHNYSDIVKFLQNITTAYSKFATYVPTIGKSIEGRDIPAVFINVGGTTKKKILFTGGQHAREWIAPHTVLFILEQLLTKYGTDSSVTRILDNVNFAIVPLVNPDGYVFSWTTTRLWRKNRRANTGGSYGVDLNRNWDTHWCTNGASKTPSSDTYCGTAPNSEPEVKALSSWMMENGPYQAYIDFHSYSQLILRPWGWTNAKPVDETVLKTVGDGMRDVIRAVHAKSYTSEPAYTLYYTTGSADDWAYERGVAKLVYTIELRDTGTYGFNLPANQITPTGEENWAAVKFLADYVITH